MTAREELHLPAVHALHLAELVKRWGAAPGALFDGLGLDEARLADPAARLSIAQVNAVVARARALTGEPGIGIHLGFQMRVSAHGLLGFAAMTAPRVRDALVLAERFAPTRTNALALHLREDRDAASVVLEELGDLGEARDAILFALVVGIWQIGSALTERPLDGSAELAIAEPAYFARFGRGAPRVRFGQPANRLVFARSVLDLPLSMADPAAQRLAMEACERSLAELGERGQLVQSVRAAARTEDGAFRTLDDVASAVGVSPRTLKRKLAAHGVAYSDLVDDERREAALLLVRSPSLSLDEVAEKLGYSDVANFRRAFRRWTGVSPAAYRRS
jgi:AraC-like DNA-binding protein